MKLRLSLRARLVILVIVAVVPLFALSLYKALRAADAALGLATSNLQFAGSLAASNQDRIAESARQLLTAIASEPSVQEGRQSNCQDFVERLRGRFPAYTNFGLIGADGTIRCHSAGSIGAPVLVGDRDYFREAVARREFVVGTYLVGRLSGQGVLTFALPLSEAGGASGGVVFAALKPEEFSRTVDPAQLPVGARLTILDRAGTVLAAYPRGAAEVGHKVADPALQQALVAGATGVREAPDANGSERIYAFAPSTGAGRGALFASVSMDREQIVGPGRALLALEMLALALGAVLGGWLAWIIGGRSIVEPARQLLDATGRLQQGELDVRVPIKRAWVDGEFGNIASGFNLMAESLQQRQNDLQTELVRSRQAYATLELVLNSMQEGLIAVDVNGRFLLFNDAAARIFPRDEAMARQPAQRAQKLGLFKPDTDMLMDPEDLPMQRALRGESGTQALALVRNALVPEGRLVSGSYHPMLGADGAILGGLVVFSDITEVQRLEAEQARHYVQLRESEERFRTLFMGAATGISMSTADGRYLKANPAYCAMVGYSEEELMEMDYRTITHPDDAPANQALNDRLLAGEIDNFVLEKRYRHRDGTIAWGRASISAVLRGPDRRPTSIVAVTEDITAQRESQEALLSSEQRYGALFDSAPVPMWVFDAETLRFLTVNDAAVRGYGFSREEFLAMTPFGIRSEAEQRRFRSDVAQGLRDGGGTWLHTRKDGSEFPVEAISRSIQYEGRPAHFVLALDITAQVKAERDNEEYLFTLQRAADAAQAIVQHQTLQGTLHEVAEQARAVIRAHQSIVTLAYNQDWAQSVSAVSLSDRYEKYRDYVGNPDGSGIYTLVCETNRPLRLTQAELLAHPRWRGFGAHAAQHPVMRGWLAVPLVGRGGKNIGVLQLSDKYEGEFTQQDEYVALEMAQLASIAIENTALFDQIQELNQGLEQKVAERTRALTRQEALFRALAEGAPQLVWTTDASGERLTFLNRAWYELVGGTPEDWLERSGIGAIHPDDREATSANWRRSRETLSVFTGVRRVRARDGSYHTMSYRASPVRDESGEVAFWVGIDADITEIKAIEEALRQSNHELEAFSYSVSHDLRSPLNTVDGFSRLLAKQLGERIDERSGHYLSRIQAGVAQMGQLIDGLLSLAQVSRTPLRHETVDLGAMAAEILGHLRQQDPGREAVIEVQPGLLVRGDPRLLRVVLDNMLGNAWKFSSLKPCTEITVGRRDGLEAAPVYFVRDNGTGFDMAYADKLFTAFQRLHAVAEFPGTGIGLATASRVIHRHGGRIWAESQPGQGTCFFFTLPPGAGA